MADRVGFEPTVRVNAFSNSMEYSIDVLLTILSNAAFAITGSKNISDHFSIFLLLVMIFHLLL